MLKRKIDDFLLDWKNRPDHNPLIIYGARQVGKTTSIEQFGKKTIMNRLFPSISSNSLN